VTGINSVSSPPGYQLNLALAALALAATVTGAGRFSIDAVITRASSPERRANSPTDGFAPSPRA
jgi:hypothetical protein